MDEGRFSVSAPELYSRLGTATAPIVIDARREPAFAADEWMLASAVRRPPEAIERWQSDLARKQPVVVYCAHGREVSQGAAASLRQLVYRFRQTIHAEV
jgi:rhodanese-related sulfurtransferase